MKNILYFQSIVSADIMKVYLRPSKEMQGINQKEHSKSIQSVNENVLAAIHYLKIRGGQ